MTNLDMYKTDGRIALKAELKAMITSGEAPKWLTWMGYQKLQGGYLLGDETPRDMYQRVAKSAAEYLPQSIRVQKTDVFFNLFWNNWLCGSTPVLGNLGTDRGMAVSCSAQYCGDTLQDILYNQFEAGILSKYGFGTAVYLDVRPGYSSITSGGRSNPVTDWVEALWFLQNKVTQSNLRRGSTAVYIDFWHPDLLNVLEMLKVKDRLHLGVIINKEAEDKLAAGDEKAFTIYQSLLLWRMRRGKPYLIFADRAKQQDPDSYKKLGLSSKHSNLCTEIFLHTDSEHTLSCVLSSMNATTFNEWHGTTAVRDSVLFLDCVASDLISRGKGIKGLEKVVRSTQKGRALGLGLLGFHTYLQQAGVQIDSIQARGLNHQIFSYMQSEAVAASQELGKEFGIPEWGGDRRNTHLLAVAPNTSSALIAGSVSQGIEPMAANTFLQKVAKGSIYRVNPVLVKILKEKKKYTEDVLESIDNNKGSVQHLDFLSTEQKQLFRTSFEINQKVLIDLAEQRQEFICQGQSLNLFFSAEESVEWIHEVHKHAFSQKRLKSLYYVRTMAGIRADKNDDCLACEG